MTRRAKQNAPSASVDLLSLAECVEQFSSKTVVLLGDFVADEFQFGEISRVSREAPVLILRHRETQKQRRPILRVTECDANQFAVSVSIQCHKEQ